MTSSIYVAKTVYGGDGLGRLGDGRVVFVRGAFAGESVKAEIFEERSSFVRARLAEIVESSPFRSGTDPDPLPGMVYANLTKEGEETAKEDQLREFLERGRFDASLLRHGPVCGADLFNYRNKVVYHFAWQDGVWAIGYRREPGHDIVDVAEDPLARPEINARLPEIRKSVLALLTQGAESVRRSVAAKGCVTIRWTARSGVQWWIGEAPRDLVLKETTCGRVFEVPADGFYQVNPAVGEALVKTVVSEFASAPTDGLIDLYCGVGVFGLCCAPKRLLGIESGRQAVEFAKRNASAQGAADARFIADRTAHALRRLRLQTDSTVVVDPPRDGMESGVTKWLSASGIRRILYVSCDPATMMRDMKALRQTYGLKSVRWFNMFPRTARFETFAVLERRA